MISQIVWIFAVVGIAAAAWAAQPANALPDRAAVLKGMQEVMGPLPDRSKLPPLDLKTTETFQGDGFKRYTVSFANLFDERVTAYLYVPDNIPSGEQRPGALALQPTGNEGKQISDGLGPKETTHGYARELAMRGYLVVAPDYPSYGEQKDYDFKKSKYISGTMKAISDNMRCIDLLQSRDDVDGEKIACIGHSLGGHNTLFTTAFDERIKVAVTSCGWTPFHYYFSGKKLVNWAQDRYMPRIRDVYHSDPDKVPFDFDGILVAIAPRAVFSNSPLRDDNFEVEGVRVAAAKVQKVYESRGAADRFVVRYPDCPHDFPDATRREAYRFIDQQFSFKPPREVP